MNTLYKLINMIQRQISFNWGSKCYWCVSKCQKGIPNLTIQRGEEGSPCLTPTRNLNLAMITLRSISEKVMFDQWKSTTISKSRVSSRELKFAEWHVSKVKTKCLFKVNISI